MGDNFKNIVKEGVKALPVDIEYNKAIYAVSVANATYINNVRVWDARWWKNILCKINWFFHFGLRKRYYNYWKNSEVKLGKYQHFRQEKTINDNL